MLGIIAALMRWIGPVQAALIHLGPDILVFVNSIKLLRVKVAIPQAVVPYARAAVWPIPSPGDNAPRSGALRHRSRHRPVKRSTSRAAASA